MTEHEMRRGKLDALQASGDDPFRHHGFGRTHTAGNFLAEVASGAAEGREPTNLSRCLIDLDLIVAEIAEQVEVIVREALAHDAQGDRALWDLSHVEIRDVTVDVRVSEYGERVHVSVGVTEQPDFKEFKSKVQSRIGGSLLHAGVPRHSMETTVHLRRKRHED